MRAHRVRALLMGGQARVFYGAAEFSRDTDLAIVADAANLSPGCVGRWSNCRPKSLPSLPSKMEELERALVAEEYVERERDWRYWLPLRAELEKLRRTR